MFRFGVWTPNAETEAKNSLRCLLKTHKIEKQTEKGLVQAAEDRLALLAELDRGQS